MENLSLPWSVTTCWHREGDEEGHERPCITGKHGVLIAEFGVGFGFEAAMGIATHVVQLVNQHAEAKKGR